MLAQALPGCTIVGGDYDKRALKYAGKHYQADNLQYQQADIVTWKRKDGTLPLGKYDVVISFDTIEHLLFRDIAFISLTENMNDDGMLLLSTPVRTECVFDPAGAPQARILGGAPEELHAALLPRRADAGPSGLSAHRVLAGSEQGQGALSQSQQPAGLPGANQVRHLTARR